MDTVRIKDVIFRLADLSAESRSYLERKMRRIKRREAQADSLYFKLVSAVLPQDYRNAPVESYVDGRVLVIGCNGGLECISMGAVGIDIDFAALRIARDLRSGAAGTTAEFMAASGGDLPFRSGTFDSVLSDNVIEHLPPPIVPRHLKETARVLKPGGKYVFSTPNEIFERPPKGDHVSLHSFEQWETMLREAGFREIVTPRRRSGKLESLDWKKAAEREAEGRSFRPGLSHRGLRIITVIARR